MFAETLQAPRTPVGSSAPPTPSTVPGDLSDIRSRAPSLTRSEKSQETSTSKRSRQSSTEFKPIKKEKQPRPKPPSDAARSSADTAPVHRPQAVQEGSDS